MQVVGPALRFALGPGSICSMGQLKLIQVTCFKPWFQNIRYILENSIFTPFLARFTPFWPVRF